MDTKRLHAYVAGRVQGVSFRYYTRQTALALGLTGWVRNLPDGRVEVVAEGSEERLHLLEEYLHRGPPAARVTNVECRWPEATREFASFELRW